MGTTDENRSVGLAVAPSVGRPSPPARHREGSHLHGNVVLAGVLLTLAAGMAGTSVIGPLGLNVMQYRTSSTTLNQLIGSDLAALFFATPVALFAAALAARRHPAAPLLATGVGVYALYTYAQVIIGQEYLRLPGNVEKFFPLLLGVFVLAEAAVVLGWRALPADLPPPSDPFRRTLGVVMFALAAFLLIGLHLRPMLTAWQDPASLTEYASSPTPFWMVKLMDLGIVVPAAIATGTGLLRRSAWAWRAVYPLLTGYTCLGVSVAAMGLVMNLQGDPDASLGLTTGFLLFALIFLALTTLLYRPLFAAATKVMTR
jgi:hypothetical protein